MKILLTILLSTAFISILGMFYWMWKARLGILVLSTNSWHFKLKKWMWDIETNEVKNACPYYWTLVLSLLILPVYILLYLAYMLFEKLPKLPKANLTIIPPTKKEMYKKLYFKSKEYLKLAFYITFTLTALIAIIYSFRTLFILDWRVFLIVLGALVYITFFLIQSIVKSEWDKYHNDHWVNLFIALAGLISFPFIVIFNIFSYVFTKITNVYTNVCPQIKWK
jgi:hypothetical protein